MAKPSEFDLDAWVKASTQASGVPEKLQDRDVIHDVVTLLARRLLNGRGSVDPAGCVDPVVRAVGL